jgi:MFS family permease
MAFWVHFACQSSGSVFVLLWGYTFLVKAEGVPTGIASLMLSSFVAIGFIVGPIMSQVCATRPEYRSRLVVGLVLSTISAWSLVLFWPGQAPLALIWLLILVIGSGGPASMIAFDFTRTLIAKDRMGTANGFVNMGGFIATFSIMFAVGWVLDLALHLGWSRTLFDMAGFRLAMFVQFAVLGLGLLFFFIELRKSAALTASPK